MTAEIWSPHLQPGERILWSATASSDLRKADLSRQRLIYGAAGAASLLIAVLLAARFVEALALAFVQPTLLAAFIPLYFVFALAMGALALWGFRRMAVPSPAATYYGATANRLMALDASGKLVSEMPGAEVDSVIASGRRRTPDVYVLHRNDPKEDHVFAIEHIDRPLEAKAFIEETFIQEHPEEASAP